MQTYTLIVAIITGAMGYNSYPVKVDTVVEKGYITEQECRDAAVPYVALQNLKMPSRHGIQVSWDCVPTKSTK